LVLEEMLAAVMVDSISPGICTNPGSSAPTMEAQTGAWKRRHRETAGPAENLHFRRGGRLAVVRPTESVLRFVARQFIGLAIDHLGGDEIVLERRVAEDKLRRCCSSCSGVGFAVFAAARRASRSFNILSCP
jgi:hypothetical protein